MSEADQITQKWSSSGSSGHILPLHWLMLILSESWCLFVPADVLSDGGSPFKPKLSSGTTVPSIPKCYLYILDIFSIYSCITVISTFYPSSTATCSRSSSCYLSRGQPAWKARQSPGRSSGCRWRCLAPTGYWSAPSSLQETTYYSYIKFINI